MIDLGFGSSPVTTVELHRRLAALRGDVQVIGLELDPERVAAARPQQRPGLTFAKGGFELAGHRPVVIRALNVLRQYPEDAAAAAWETMRLRLSADGVLIEGTSDELGRRCAWVTLGPHGPRSLTLAAHLPSLDRPSDLAVRLPKSLIHRNRPGEAVHALLHELDAAWAREASLAVFGPRQRWIGACARLDWPQLTPGRSRFGELTVPWESVAPGRT